MTDSSPAPGADAADQPAIRSGPFPGTAPAAGPKAGPAPAARSSESSVRLQSIGSAIRSRMPAVAPPTAKAVASG